jgi:hypothetical protein
MAAAAFQAASSTSPNRPQTELRFGLRTGEWHPNTARYSTIQDLSFESLSAPRSDTNLLRNTSGNGEHCLYNRSYVEHTLSSPMALQSQCLAYTLPFYKPPEKQEARCTQHPIGHSLPPRFSYVGPIVRPIE